MSRGRPWAEFAEKYKPVYRLQEDGSETPLREPGDKRVEAVDVHYLWTVVDTDFGLMLLPGAHVVNFFGYVVCDVKWHGHISEILDYDFEEGT
jgi:hypothetical protein